MKLRSLVLSVLLVTAAHAQDTQRLYLSGHGKDDAVPWRFQCTYGAHSGYWTNLPVPSHWDMHGFGTLNYKKDATNAWDERGLYQLDFRAPKDWSGKRVVLVFDGVMTDTSAAVNGRSAGPVHQGGFYRFKYDVTKLLKFGKTNRLEVTVAKHSTDNSVNRAERLADYWVFGGIYRPAYLEAVPPQFIERVAVDARADGAFALEVFAEGARKGDIVEAQILTLDGKPVGMAFSSKTLNPTLTRPRQGGATLSHRMGEGRSEGRFSIETRIDSPRQWTAETPNLYQVEVRLKQGKKVLHRIRQRFGFRTMEVREGDGLYLNGRKIVLKGVNRHSFWPESGRCLSEAVHRLDIETMKDMNLNAVRMSHYPPDAEFLDLCDELGLYVLDELAGWHNFYDTGIGRKLVEEMVTRDVNHPSILFWDNGNEGGFNTNLDALYLEFDPQQRHVLHPWTIFGGVNTGHYNRWEEARAFCASNTIYMPTEFQHGLFDGGAGAALEDYWRVMGRSPVCAGGFIWAFTDDGVKRSDTGEIDTAGNQAPDGIVGPYRQREGSFYTIKEIWSPIQVQREADDTFTVENRYSFTDASQCRFTWQLQRVAWPLEAQPTNQILAAGTISAPAIPPGGQGSFRLELPRNAPEADLLRLRVEDPGGRELWTWVWPLRQREVVPSSATIVGRFDAFGGTNSGGTELKVKDLIVRIDGKTGELTEAERSGDTFSLSNGPRAATTNSVLKKIVWQLREDGWLQCDYTYAVSGTNDYFGVVFDYPENLVKRKRWFGLGPYRVWKNRLAGGTLGVWENDYNNTITGWRDWIYPEFKGCFAGVRWMQLDTSEGLITIVPDRTDRFVQVLTPEFPPTNVVGKTFLTLPHAGLALLDAIPPVGSKFKDATTTGPQGQPNVADGEFSGSIKLYFGTFPTGSSNSVTSEP